MLPISNKHTNITYTLSGCQDLPAHRDECANMIYTYWRPSWRERLAVLFGITVRLTIKSNRPPPLALEATGD